MSYAVRYERGEEVDGFDLLEPGVDFARRQSRLLGEEWRVFAEDETGAQVEFCCGHQV